MPISKSKRRVVCAAILYQDFIVCGARHFDMPMHSVLGKIPHHITEAGFVDQGFIDQWGVFMDRKEAFLVAKSARQIRRKTGGKDSKKLYSEDLY